MTWRTIVEEKLQSQKVCETAFISQTLMRVTFRHKRKVWFIRSLVKTVRMWVRTITGNRTLKKWIVESSCQEIWLWKWCHSSCPWSCTAYIDWDQAKVWLYRAVLLEKEGACRRHLSMAEMHSQVGLLKDEADLTNETRIVTFKENGFGSTPWIMCHINPAETMGS